MSDSAETYKVLETDAFNWLETAEGLQMSAKLSWDAFSSLRRVPPNEVREQMLAYTRSFMLLMAFSFENICRGIASLVKPDGWKYLANRKGGHDLVNTVPEFVTITEAERDLLRRLETYLRWAGRYSIPKKVNHYIGAVQSRSRKIRSSDWDVSCQLFARLKAHLQATHDQIQAAAPDPMKRWP
jgi:hypothetical protein